MVPKTDRSGKTATLFASGDRFVVETKRLSYNFGPHWAIKDVSFTLEKGDKLFLTGPSGAGKTTLLKLLHGALPVSRGQARVAGVDLHDMKTGDLTTLRRNVGFVFQDFKILMHRTAAQNTALALEVRFMPAEQIAKRVRAVLRSLELDHKADVPCAALSGGEQQRTAIARAIVVNPTLLLADEPTGNLDPELSLRLMDVFDQFNAHGMTVIVATHNRGLIRSAEGAKIAVLKNGRIVDANWDGAKISPLGDA